MKKIVSLFIKANTILCCKENKVIRYYWINEYNKEIEACKEIINRCDRLKLVMKNAKKENKIF